MPFFTTRIAYIKISNAFVGNNAIINGISLEIQLYHLEFSDNILLHCKRFDKIIQCFCFGLSNSNSNRRKRKEQEHEIHVYIRIRYSNCTFFECTRGYRNACLWPLTDAETTQSNQFNEASQGYFSVYIGISVVLFIVPFWFRGFCFRFFFRYGFWHLYNKQTPGDWPDSQHNTPHYKFH